MENTTDNLVAVAIYSSPVEANIALGMLRSNGIECVLTGETVNSVLGIQLAPADGIRLLVHEKDANKATDLLNNPS